MKKYFSNAMSILAYRQAYNKLIAALGGLRGT